MKKVMVLLISLLMMVVSLVGCNGNDDTIQTCIISNSSYSSQGELELANQEDALTVNEPIYASVHFVESPKGMEYTVKWYLDDTEVKSETKATEKDMQDIVIYELEAEQAIAGSLKLEVIYKDTILLTKELTVQ